MSDIKNQFNESEFSNTTFNYGGKKIFKALGSIPAIPNLFLGRASATKDIHEELTNSSNHHLLLLVNGNGGIGKTTIASQYYFEYAEYYSHLIWLVSKNGIKDAIISLSLSLRISFPDGLTQSQQLTEILRSISELKKPVLLIIDNANKIKDLDDNFRLLRQFQNIHILITSRVENYQEIESYKINKLDKTAANALFKHHYKNFKTEEQELLDGIMDAIGYNTLVMELLAKNLHEFNNDFKDHYPLKRLLEDIQQKGLLAISKSVEVRADYQLEPAKPEDIIREMYDISPLSEDEQCILSVYAVLPATTIPFKYLELFLPNIEQLDKILLKLADKGWIEYDKKFKSFKTNPIISEIAREQNKNRIERDTLDLLGFLTEKLDYQTGIGHIEGDFDEIKNYVFYAEIFLSNSRLRNHNISILYERLGNFYKTYGNLEKALKFFEDYLALKKELYTSDPNNVDFKNGLAISYSKLGETYSSLGDLEKALKYFEEETDLFEELYASYPNNIDFKNGLSISYEKLGETHSSLGNLEKALKFFEDDLKLTKELYASYPNNVGFKNGLSISYEKLGETHSSLGNLEEALKYFKDDLKLTKELYESYPNNVGFKNGLAISYSKLGDTHSSLGNLEKALKYFGERSRLGKELYASYPNNVGFKNGLAISYVKLGVLLVDELNNKEKGIGFLNSAMDIFKELHEKHPNYKEFKTNYEWTSEKIQSLQ